jgi:hypothetical protein
MAHHEREVADLVRVHPPKMANQRSWIRWPHWPSNWTLLLNPTVLKMLVEKCNYLPTKMRGCFSLLQPQLLHDVERNINIGSSPSSSTWHSNAPKLPIVLHQMLPKNTSEHVPIDSKKLCQQPYNARIFTVHFWTHLLDLLDWIGAKKHLELWNS